MIKLAKEWEVPLVISALGTIERKVAYEGSYTSKQIIKAMNFADRILSVSEDLKTHIINLGIDESKVEVVPNGVDIERFRPAGKENARNILNLPQKKNIVLFIGALRKIKGVDYLIEAAKSFVNAKTELYIVGRDDGLKKSLEKMAEERKISTSSSLWGLLTMRIFLSGFQPQIFLFCLLFRKGDQMLFLKPFHVKSQLWRLM